MTDRHGTYTPTIASDHVVHSALSRRPIPTGWVIAVSCCAVAGVAAREAGLVWATPVWLVSTGMLVFDASIALRSAAFTVTLQRAAAWCAPLTALPTAGVIARQYVERATPDGRYLGPLLPLLLWTGTVASSLAVLLGLAVIELTPLRRRRRCTIAPELLAAVVSLGFLWRTYALLRIAPVRTDGGDPLYYHTQANTIARGLGFIEPLTWIAEAGRIPTALHGPGYSLFLAFFSRLGASTWFDHRMASVLVGTGVVLVAGLLGRRLAGSVAGIVAAGLAALYPNLWTIDIVLFPEGLFVLCCGLAMLYAYRWHDHHRPVDAVLLGLTIGAAALTRGEGVLLVILLVAPLVLRAASLSPRRRVTALVLSTVGCLLLMGPWMVRNLGAFEKFVPLSTNGNELHVYSNCDDTYSGKFLGFWLFDCQQRIRDPDRDGVIDFEPAGDESEKAAYWQQVGFSYARDHASELPKVVLARIGRQWELFRPLQNAEFAPIEGRDAGWARAGLVSYYGLVVASAFGIRALRRRKVTIVPLVAQFIAVTLTAAYAYGTTRFRAPAELVLCVLAGIGLTPSTTRALDALRRPLVRTAGLEPTGTPTRNWWRPTRWWHITLPTLAGAAMLRGLYLAPGAPMEEGFMLVFPERLLEGDIPNVDFLHLYGPGSLHLLAGIYEVLGATVDVQRSIGLVFNAAIVSALVVIARPWGRTVMALAGLMGILVVFTPIGLAALAWHGAIALALWSVVVGLRPTRHRAWLAGLLAGLALSFRPDLVLALAVAHGVRWWIDRRSTPPGSGPWWVGTRGAAVGILVGLVPFLVHTAVAGPVAVWRGIFIEPVFTLRAGRTLPRPPSWDRWDGALQNVAERPPPWWPVPALSGPHQLFIWFWLLPLLSIGGVLLATHWWRQDRPPRVRRLLVVGVFGCGLLTQAVQRPDSTHLLWGSVVSFPLAICWLAEWWSRRPSPGTALGRIALLMTPLLLVVMVLPYYTVRTYTMHVRQALGPSFGGLPPGLPVVRGERLYRLGEVRAWKAGQALVDDLDRLATPGERLLVGPVDLRQTAYSDVFFYHLFPELTPATRYIEMDPGIANAPDSGLADDVASADWLVLTRYWSGWLEPNTSAVFGPDEPNIVVEEQFCLVGSYERDLTRLYRRCDGGGAPGPYEGPYDPTVDYAVEIGVPVPPRSDGTYPPGSPAAP